MGYSAGMGGHPSAQKQQTTDVDDPSHKAVVVVPVLAGDDQGDVRGEKLEHDNPPDGDDGGAGLSDKLVTIVPVVYLLPIDLLGEPLRRVHGERQDEHRKQQRPLREQAEPVAIAPRGRGEKPAFLLLRLLDREGAVRVCRQICRDSTLPAPHLEGQGPVLQRGDQAQAEEQALGKQGHDQRERVDLNLQHFVGWARSQHRGVCEDHAGIQAVAPQSSIAHELRGHEESSVYDRKYIKSRSKSAMDLLAEDELWPLPNSVGSAEAVPSFRYVVQNVGDRMQQHACVCRVEREHQLEKAGQRHVDPEHEGKDAQNEDVPEERGSDERDRCRDL
mmetsp:Transcript_82782/g.216079  ORF Transcript_82782/g.216079 Transcript_82782/m.216079 type:complete len:332 (-) Transcript_82782:1135-2130(-)